MAALCMRRIRYTRILVHLVSGDLAGGIDEGGDSSGHRFSGVVDLVLSTCVIDLMLEDSNQFTDSMAMTLALGRCSLGNVHKYFLTVINNVRLAPVREQRQQRVNDSLWR
jgi:hypothetical protein